MKTFKEFILEETSDVMTPAQMRDHIGKAKFNAVTKHPWYREHFANQEHVGMRYVQKGIGSEVHVAHAPVGKEKYRKMAQFQLSHSGRRVHQVNLYHNSNDERYEGGGLHGHVHWHHVKSYAKDDE